MGRNERQTCVEESSSSFDPLKQIELCGRT